MNKKTGISLGDKVVLLGILLFFSIIIYGIIVSTNKQSNCGEDVKLFCESNLMDYGGDEMNKHICTQSIIGGYTQKFLFSCQYTKNATILILERTEIIKWGESNESN